MRGELIFACASGRNNNVVWDRKGSDGVVRLLLLTVVAVMVIVKDRCEDEGCRDVIVLVTEDRISLYD